VPETGDLLDVTLRTDGTFELGRVVRTQLAQIVQPGVGENPRREVAVDGPSVAPGPPRRELHSRCFPHRPARPARFQKSAAPIGLSLPFFGLRAKRFRHGRFTPSRSVEVHTRYLSLPSRNSRSISLRTSTACCRDERRCHAAWVSTRIAGPSCQVRVPRQGEDADVKVHELRHELTSQLACQTQAPAPVVWWSRAG
jgi:hypothetical protein